MAKKEVNRSYLLVVVVVVLVAVVALVLKNSSLEDSSLEGAQVFVPEEKRVKTCVDTDEDNDPRAKGHVQVGVAKYYDYCRGNNLYQYKCKTGTKAELVSRPTNCKNGCENGVCL